MGGVRADQRARSQLRPVGEGAARFWAGCAALSAGVLLHLPMLAMLTLLTLLGLAGALLLDSIYASNPVVIGLSRW